MRIDFLRSGLVGWGAFRKRWFFEINLPVGLTHAGISRAIGEGLDLKMGCPGFCV